MANEHVKGAGGLRLLYCGPGSNARELVALSGSHDLALDVRIVAVVEEILPSAESASFDAVVLGDEELLEIAEAPHALNLPVVLFQKRLGAERASRWVREGIFACASTAAELLEVLRQLASRNRPRRLRPVWRPSEREVLSCIVFRSREMQHVVEQVRVVAAKPTTVLILGESGTGKELVARALHGLSERSTKTFLAVDCGSIPESLVESELFGHVKGAFSGAVAARPGRLKIANRGTLFLDEIDELSLHTQAKLLRTIEERTVWPLGADKATRIDVRIVAATDGRLREMVEQGLFKRALYHRLGVFVIELPPLRKRGADVLLLAEHFVHELNKRFDCTVTGLSPAARARLLSYTFPGNVRELRNVLEVAILSRREGEIQADDLQLAFEGRATAEARAMLSRAPAAASAELPEEIDTSQPLRKVLDAATRRLEYDYFSVLLVECGGNVSQVALRSGVERRNLYRKLRELNIDAASFRASTLERGTKQVAVPGARAATASALHEPHALPAFRLRTS